MELGLVFLSAAGGMNVVVVIVVVSIKSVC